MSMNYNILNNKSTFTKEDNYEGTTSVEMYDLLSTSFNKYLQAFGTPIIVSKEYIGRPDLISFSVYEDEKYADVLCKINNISNPFELNVGDILYCPPIGVMSRFFDYQDDSGVDGYSNSNYSNDESIITNNDTQYQKSKNDPTLQPNEQTIGDSDFIIDRTHNIVFY